MVASRRGFTLIELMTALVIFTLVAGSISRFLINSQRLSRTQIERIGLQSDLRTGVLVVPSELRELAANGTGSDILSMASNNISFRAMRGVGFICQVSATEIRLLDTGAIPFYGARYVDHSRDMVDVFVENDPDVATDDTWLMLQPTGMDRSSSCGTNAAIRLSFNDFSGQLPNGIGDIVMGGPVRSFEVMELGRLATGGQTWLGARSISGGQSTLLPVLGPLTSNGFQLQYFDSGGVATTNPNNVRQIRVMLRGMTDHAVTRALGDVPAVMQDSLVAVVTLRNAG
jgi:prepilin-type N-terminal cleavage/methylation domain-containing protein